MARDVRSWPTLAVVSHFIELSLDSMSFKGRAKLRRRRGVDTERDILLLVNFGRFSMEMLILWCILYETLELSLVCRVDPVECRLL